MMDLKSSGLLLCCLSIGGVSLRSSRKAENDAGASANGVKYPAREGCMPRYGYDVVRGCAHPTPFQPVESCETVNFPDSCLQISSVETVTGYLRNVRSSSDYSSLTNTVVQAEGSGWGVKVSAGFEYMRSSQVGEKSMAFFIGLGGEVQQHTVQQPLSLKLTDDAKELIGRNPRGFIDQFGLGYIHTMALGGSFLGSVTLNSRQTSDSTDVRAFVELSVNKGFFSAKGAAEFRDKEKSENLKVETYTNAKWSGGANITANFTDSESLGLMFREWDSTWRLSPKPLNLVRRPWTDSADVQKFVNLMSESDRALFVGPMISTTIAQEISKEDVAVAKMATSVDKALAWHELHRDARACFRTLSRDVAQRKIIIETLDEADVVVIQGQFLDGNYSWFKSTTFQDRYEQCESLTPTLWQWQLAVNIHASDGHNFGYGASEWYQGTNVGTDSNAYTADYLSPSVYRKKVGYVAIARHQNGLCEAVKVWELTDKSKSLLNYFQNHDGGRMRVTGDEPYQEFVSEDMQGKEQDPITGKAGGGLVFNWWNDDNGVRIATTKAHWSGTLPQPCSRGDDVHGLGNELGANTLAGQGSSGYWHDVANLQRNMNTSDFVVQGTDHGTVFSDHPLLGQYAVFVSTTKANFLCEGGVRLPTPGTAED